ncbi:Glutamate synthase 1 [Forsythia ovata]|uniref:Glutamate synthase 1 n=1 Tax=Forsythia ovata TaxID=205694 RepID=A0ABD1UWJ9_9LAMI
MLHIWRTDGPGWAPKLVVKNALSQVPEKLLGLYDPSFDNDSSGVGFVAELSGESSRKFWDPFHTIWRENFKRNGFNYCSTLFNGYPKCFRLRQWHQGKCSHLQHFTPLIDPLSNS